MSQPEPKDIVRSIHNKLLERNRTRREDFNYVLARYGIERLLYRLTKSAYANKFVVKGAMLFLIWTGETYRPTNDLDLLGYGEVSSDHLRSVFQQICNTQVEPDGLVFDPESIKISEIREDQEYHGKRIQLVAWLGTARINLQIDIGYGDAITPEAQEVTYPTLINFPSPRIRVYPRETVIAEKLQAIVALGTANSRMKDFLDIHVLSQQFAFDGVILCKAIKSTFDRRKTPIPNELPIGLTGVFADIYTKQAQWNAFIKRSRLSGDTPGFREVINSIAVFLGPALLSFGKGERFTMAWPPHGPWS